MSAGTLTAVILMVLAIVGMGTWMMSLDHRQDDLEQSSEGAGVSALIVKR